MTQGQSHHEVRMRQNVKSQYVFKERLGSGTHGVVYLAVERSTGLLRAVKKIRKKPGLDIIRFTRELKVLMNFRHPQIVKVYEAFEDCNALYIIMEYCRGGDLCDRLESEGAFPESAAAYFMRQALGAVSMCHANGIMHRDIKLENFLFTTKDARSPLKLTDFGLCRYFSDTSEPPSLVGTISYLAPEVLSLNYNHSADLWSLGVLLYMLLVDNFPFGQHALTETDVLKEIKNGVLEFHAGPNGVPSALAQDLIKSLCQIDPTTRLSATQALKHPWITMLSPSPLQYLPIILRNSNRPLNSLNGQIVCSSKNSTEVEPNQSCSSRDSSNLSCTGRPPLQPAEQCEDQAYTVRAPQTVQQFLQSVQCEQPDSAQPKRELPSRQATLAPIIAERLVSKASAPSMTHSRERSIAIAQRLRTEIGGGTMSQEGSGVLDDINCTDASPTHKVKTWASSTSIHRSKQCSANNFGTSHHFCCDMFELCSRHSRRCTIALGRNIADNHQTTSIRLGECDLCATLRRLTNAIWRLGITTASSAAALGQRLLARWKAFQYLSATEKYVLTMIARQMDTSELTYFGCLYELLDCDRTGDICIEQLSRAVAYICECENIVCHGKFPILFARNQEDHKNTTGSCPTDVDIKSKTAQMDRTKPNCSTMAAIVTTLSEAAETPTVLQQSVKAIPASPATVAPLGPVEKHDALDSAESETYANDLSYITSDLRICEECTSSTAFASYVKILSEVRTLLHTHIDLNHNGRIEVDEFCAACMDQLLVLKPIASKILFKSLNVNHTPTVTVADFMHAFTDTAAPDSDLIHHVDPDGDGLIEENGLKALLWGSAARLSRASGARLCEESKEPASQALSQVSPRDAMDFRHLMPKQISPT